MPLKNSIRAFISISILIALLVIPLQARAGGVCGGIYMVEQGDTLEKIAAMCGITVSAIYSANPGISPSLYVGQSLMLPGGGYYPSATPMPPIPPAAPTTIANYYTTNNYNYYYNTYNGNAPTNYYRAYIVQYGDTFSGIAARFGLTVNELWAANPFIWNINFLYAGQLLNIPSSLWNPSMPAPTATMPESLSYGSVPRGTAEGTIKLVNKSNSDVYISFQGTTRDGYSTINEYSVNDTMKVNIPSAWYFYVAWVGGIQYTGQFHLGGGSDHVVTFYKDKVVVQ